MKKNIDGKRILEKELEKYKKKVSEQEKIIANLQSEIGGAMELAQLAEAILLQTALTYGEKVLDDESCEELGCSITLPFFKVENLVGRYESRTRKDMEKKAFVIGVMEREEEQSNDRN